VAPTRASFAFISHPSQGRPTPARKELSFLSAVVENFSDDVPTLIYADWLEERGDPRGPFLRSFVEAASDEDQPRLPPSQSFPIALPA
jgi:uncharacterized protein (TIGR02996 family)